MKREIEVITTSENPNVTHRFDQKLNLISKLKVIDETSEKLFWERLKDGILLNDYSLNIDKFEQFEKFNFEGDYEKITERLNNIFKEPEQIILSWFTSERSLLTDSASFIQNWEYFFSPSADDLLIFNKNFNWLIYIAHYEYFYFGQGMKSH